MPKVLPNTTTADTYPGIGAGGAQIGRTDEFASGFFVVANAAVFASYYHGIAGQIQESPDIYMPPGTYPLIGTEKDPVAGIRFKSAVAGIPAQVFGVLFYPNEASLLSSAQFTGSVSAGGIVTPQPTTLDTAKLRVSGVPIALVTGVQTTIPLLQAYDWDTNTAIWPVRGAASSQFQVSQSGLYRCTIFVRYAASGVGQRYTTLHINGGGGEFWGEIAASAAGLDFESTFGDLLQLVTGDYIELICYQSSGGNLNLVDGHVVMEKIT